MTAEKYKSNYNSPCLENVKKVRVAGTFDISIKIAVLAQLVVFIIGIIIGYAFLYFKEMDTSSDSELSSNTEEIRLRKEYKFINPLLECNIPFNNYKYPKEVKRKVNEYLATQEKSGKISGAAVYFRDLNNGPWFGINEGTLFTPASLIKVPLMMTFYKMAETDPAILSKKLKLTKTADQLISDTAVKKSQVLKNSSEYTVDELINQMIMESDNDAYKTLKDTISEDMFYEVFRDLGADVTRIKTSTSENVLSIHEYAAFFRILYNSSYLNREYSEKSLELLSKTNFKDGIAAGVPSSVTVANKFGEGFYADKNEKQLHDCGIIYRHDMPYLLCTMTRGSDFDSLKETIRNISKIVFESMDK